MTIEEAITQYVLAQSTIAAYIGRRFGWDEMSLGTDFPYMIGQCIDDIKLYTHQGQNKLESPNYQLTVYAQSRATARAVAEATKTVLCDYVGTMGGLTIQWIKLINELPDTLTSSDGTLKVQSVSLEFQIFYNRE